MSFSRLALVAFVAGISVFAVNANAAPADQSAQTTTIAADTHTAEKAKMMQVKVTKIDLNNADRATLAKIKIIGSKKAALIVAYRTKNGAFTSVEDLKNIKNHKGKAIFSDKALKRLNQRLTIGNADQTQTSTH